MSLQQGANANLFVMDLRSKRTTRLTDTAAIDTAPCYSPDGARICFEIRSRRPAADLCDGRGRRRAQRISFGEGTYSTPVWSPRGDFIAFTKQGGGQFAIGIMKPDGSGERLLTSGYHNEGPTFAPNGRVLMFFRDPGGAGPVALYGRRHRPQRAAGPDAGLRVRSGLVAAAVVRKRLRSGNLAAHFPPRSHRINHSKRFTAVRCILTGSRQGLIKVDGTFA